MQPVFDNCFRCHHCSRPTNECEIILSVVPQPFPKRPTNMWDRESIVSSSLCPLSLSVLQLQGNVCCSVVGSSGGLSLVTRCNCNIVQDEQYDTKWIWFSTSSTILYSHCENLRPSCWSNSITQLLLNAHIAVIAHAMCHRPHDRYTVRLFTYLYSSLPQVASSCLSDVGQAVLQLLCTGTSQAVTSTCTNTPLIAAILEKDRRQPDRG